MSIFHCRYCHRLRAFLWNNHSRGPVTVTRNGKTWTQAQCPYSRADGWWWET